MWKLRCQRVGGLNRKLCSETLKKYQLLSLYLWCSYSNPVKKGDSLHFWQGFDLWRPRRIGHSYLVLFHCLLDLYATNYLVSGSLCDWWRPVCVDSAESGFLGIPVIQEFLLLRRTSHFKLPYSCLFPFPDIQRDSCSAWLLWQVLPKVSILSRS